MVGSNTYIDFNNDSERLSFLKDYDTLTIVPLLHSNVIHLLGIADLESYLTFKRDGDKVYALGIDNFLSTWSVVTGKLLWQEQLKDKVDVDGWKVFARDE